MSGPGGSGRQSDLVENKKKVDVKALKAYFLAKTSGNNSPLPSLHGEIDLFLSGTDKGAAKPKKEFKPTIPLDARRAKTQLAKVVDNSEELSKVNKEDAAALCARGGFLSSHHDCEHGDRPSQIATTDQPTSVVYSGTESELDVSCNDSCMEDKASTPRKQDRGKKFRKKYSQLCRWKATELRQFLLYTGPIVLKRILPSPIYNYFLCFHVAIKFLCSQPICFTHNHYCKRLLKHFSMESGKLYGAHFIKFNVHCQIHLPDDGMRFGSLDKFGSFPFENYLQQLKRRNSHSNNPLAQLVKRLSESSKTQNYCELKTILFQ
jgi:hypothetical protein